MARVGVLEIVAPGPARGPLDAALRHVTVRQAASVMPQVVAAWARRGGHRVDYAVYHGQRDPLSLLPGDLDVALISCHSRGSVLAYALSVALRRRGVVTVLGGPHASSFPDDAARFFDLVVDQCDEALLADILRAPRAHRGVVTTERPLREIPPLAERLADVERAAFVGGRRTPATTVPLLASVGCPYTCDFCIDGRRRYASLDAGALRDDLVELGRRHPGIRVVFHDPNFAVRFDAVLEVLESIPPARRLPFAMQASMAILRPARLGRLRDAGCVYVAPSLESWSGYSVKAGVGKASGEAKLEASIAHAREIARHVPGVQINIIYGLDADGDGREHAALTHRFVEALPEVFVTATIAMPYGGTELYERMLREGRILRRMPLALSYMPHVATVPLGADARPLYEHLIAFFEQARAPSLLARRLRSSLPAGLKLLHGIRSQHARRTLGVLRSLRRRLDEDPHFAAFHRGEEVPTPEVYRAAVRSLAGRYAPALDERIFEPVHALPAAPPRSTSRLTPPRAPLREAAS
jgi:hypothetical protein